MVVHLINVSSPVGLGPEALQFPPSLLPKISMLLLTIASSKTSLAANTRQYKMYHYTRFNIHKTQTIILIFTLRGEKRLSKRRVLKCNSTNLQEVHRLIETDPNNLLINMHREVQNYNRHEPVKPNAVISVTERERKRKGGNK